MANPAPPTGPYPPGLPIAPVKKTNPLIWILVALLAVFVVVALAAVAGGLFIAKKVHDVASNPAEAGRLLVAANPDLEVVSTDGSGRLTVRDKRSGKTVSMNLEDIKQGKLSFEDDGKRVTMEANSSGFHVKSSDGSTVNLGSGSAKMPGWLPVYPGSSEPRGAYSMQGGSEEAATLGFTTNDPPTSVLEFYAGALRKAGMQTTQSLRADGGKSTGGMVSGESEDKKRQVTVNVSTSGGETSVGVTFSSKK